ncbi:MAG TPA: TetR family transcriptional regulator [Vineibacter sp.]|nr:TetR family transcriptional regulator [Vineibacter sp.]
MTAPDHEGKAEMAGNTREKIVNAAEMLLARDGWANVSVRAVASQAKVNLSAISYHFGSFQALRTAVLARRLIPLNEQRMQNLAALQERHDQPSLDQILHAFLAPLLALSSSPDPGARAFLLVLVRNSIEPSEEYLSITGNDLAKHTAAFVDAVGQVVPGVPDGEIRHRFRFAIGAISQALATPTPRRLGWEADIVQQLVTFLVAGFKAAATIERRKKAG